MVAAAERGSNTEAHCRPNARIVSQKSSARRNGTQFLALEHVGQDRFGALVARSRSRLCGRDANRRKTWMPMATVIYLLPWAILDQADNRPPSSAAEYALRQSTPCVPPTQPAPSSPRRDRIWPRSRCPADRA